MESALDESQNLRGETQSRSNFSLCLQFHLEKCTLATTFDTLSFYFVLGKVLIFSDVPWGLRERVCLLKDGQQSCYA